MVVGGAGYIGSHFIAELLEMDLAYKEKRLLSILEQYNKDSILGRKGKIKNNAPRQNQDTVVDWSLRNRQVQNQQEEQLEEDKAFSISNLIILDSLEKGHIQVILYLQHWYKEQYESRIAVHTKRLKKNKNLYRRIEYNSIKGLEFHIIPKSMEAFFQRNNAHKPYLKLLSQLDTLFHFGAYIEVGESVSNPQRYLKNNFLTPKLMIQNLLKWRDERLLPLKVVFSSTAAVYGSPINIPIEETEPLEPINPYGHSKLNFEKFLTSLAEENRIYSVIFRYFNAAGAHDKLLMGEDHNPETHLIPIVLQVANGKRDSVQIYGSDYLTKDGTCVRDFVHVLDLAQAHILAVYYLDNGGESTQFNLGSQEGYTVREVIDACKHVTGKPIQVEEISRRLGDPSQLVASSKKAEELLKWSRKFTDIRSIVKTSWSWHSRFPNGYTDDSYRELLEGMYGNQRKVLAKWGVSRQTKNSHPSLLYLDSSSLLQYISIFILFVVIVIVFFILCYWTGQCKFKTLMAYANILKREDLRRLD